MIRHLNAVHLNGLRAVEAVARTGSLQGAADELGVSASAVSQQVNRTEKQLGKVLLSRTPRGMVPTEAGAYPRFYEQVAASILDGASVPVDPRSALETVRIIEQAHAQSAS